MVNVEGRLKQYRNKEVLIADEQKIQMVIDKSMTVFYEKEQKGMLSYHEFLWAQLKMVQKRWWMLQFFLLWLLWEILKNTGEEIYMERSMGVMATLFVILVIPEFWKNKSSQSMEIEAAAYYSLRQVYAARILLFGIMDVFLLTIFCSAAAFGLHVTIWQLMVQFLFPMSVTACICFRMLCSRHAFQETAAIALCIFWSMVWMVLIMNERIYTKLTMPVWGMLMAMAVFYAAFALYRLLKRCDHDWEVSQNGIELQ